MASPTEKPAGEENRYAAFKHAAFIRFWLARFLATFSANIVSVAVGWQIYDLTRDPFDLGLVGLIQFLPALLLVLVTGAIADRYGRGRIMGLASFVEGLCATAILYFSFKGLTSPLPIFVILLFFGIARAFFAPASTAIIANVVPEKDFANAVAWNASAWQGAAIVGPVAGGLLYGLSAETAYIVAAIMFFLSSALSFTNKLRGQLKEIERPNLESLLAGFKYIYREKVVFGAISLDLFAVLFGGAVALLPVYARDILELGPWGLGLLRAAPGIGALILAFWLTGKSITDRAGLIMLTAVGLFGAFTALFSVSTMVWLSIAALALLGAADMVSVYIRETLIQLWTPDKLRGRVNAVNMVFIGASNELGEFRAGTMAAFIGTVPAVLFGGIGAMGLAVLWAFLFPELLKVKNLHNKELR